jgi:hypothetical protein
MGENGRNHQINEKMASIKTYAVASALSYRLTLHMAMSKNSSRMRSGEMPFRYKLLAIVWPDEAARNDTTAALVSMS